MSEDDGTRLKFEMRRHGIVSLGNKQPITLPCTTTRAGRYDGTSKLDSMTSNVEVALSVLVAPQLRKTQGLSLSGLVQNASS